MNDLPFIDRHSIRLEASPVRAWPALISMLRSMGTSHPAPLTRVLGLHPAEMHGAWRDSPVLGDSIPGFEATEVEPCELLVLEGGHRFSRYALLFRLREDGAGSILEAETWAEFPGLSGALYRAAVIGSRGHRIAVRRMLGTVARRA
jgi:hypothetical protein